MSGPFFSILLPTKNRSTIVGEAIQSALDQTFEDFELVVSDNDDSPTATADAVARFHDARIRYHRTSGMLPMHENWENAFNLASGRYIIVLEDKMRLVRNALEILHHHLTRLGDVVISYDIKFAKGATLPPPAEYPQSREVQSTALVQTFCQFRQRFFNMLPKGLDSCAPRELLTRIKAASPTGMLFSHISPDYTSGFMILAATQTIHWIPHGLVYIPNDWMWQGQHSNGQASYRKTDSYKRFLASLPVNRDQILDHVPIKTEFFWINSVIYDFLTKYRNPNYRAEISWVDYFAFCKSQIIIGRKLGADMIEQSEELRKALRKESIPFRVRVQLNFFVRLLEMAMMAARKLTSK